MKSKNIYIIGRIRGTNRTQYLIKYLLDKGQNVYLDTQDANLNDDQFNFTNRVLNFLGRKTTELVMIYKIWKSDLVIVPAMANMRQKELRWANKFKKQIYTDFYISLYDSQIIDKKLHSTNSKKARILKQMDKNCIEMASKVFFLNKIEANYYLDTLGLSFDQTKYKVIPLCIEESFKCKLNYFFGDRESNILNICWWGTYIPLHGLEKIIKAAKILDSEYDLKFHFYLFGTDDEKAKPFKELIKEMHIGNRISLDNTKTFQNGKLGDFLEKNCDLVLGNFGDSEKAKNVIVNKLIDGVAMKAPVLTGESIAPKEYFNEDVIFYSPNSADKIAEMIYLISAQSVNQMDYRINKAYDIYESNFSVSAYYKKLNKVFDFKL